MFWCFHQVSFSHVLILCLSLSLCVLVPRWNHQKHPRGSGDDNLWPLVLSSGCHRLGYKGSRDPHWISERGKRVILSLSNSVNLTNQSGGRGAENTSTASSFIISSSFFTPPCIVVSPFAFSSSPHCAVFCFVVACRLLCWANNSKLWETPSCFDWLRKCSAWCAHCLLCLFSSLIGG